MICVTTEPPKSERQNRTAECLDTRRSAAFQSKFKPSTGIPVEEIDPFGGICVDYRLSSQFLTWLAFLGVPKSDTARSVRGGRTSHRGFSRSQHPSTCLKDLHRLGGNQW